LKFYTGFYLAQSSIDSSGLSYSGSKNGKHAWNIVLMCGRFAEFSANTKVAIENWNSSVQTWLRRYIYTRLVDHDSQKGKTPNVEKATWLTFGISAFWHGFYPSYYYSFMMMWVLVDFGRWFFRAKEKLRLPPLVYAAIDYLITFLGCSFGVTNHVMLSWPKSLRLWKSVYMLPVIIPLSLSILLRVSGLATKKKSHHHAKGNKDLKEEHEKKEVKKSQ